MTHQRATTLLTTLLAAGLAGGCGDDAIEPTTPTTVTVAPASITLQSLGETAQVVATVRDQNGQVMAVAGTWLTWASNDASVATVGGSGLVTAVNNGTTTVTATAGSASGTTTVTVAQEVSAVTVSSSRDTLLVTDTLRLSAKAADANGRPVSTEEFAWASGDTLVAVVDGEGLVRGISVGETEITATSAGVTGRARLTVVVPAPTVVAVSSDTLVLAIGQTAQLSAMVLDQAGRLMAGVPVSWSSVDALVAETDSTGRVTAVGDGETTVTATADEASGSTVVRVGDRAILELLYDATNGRKWTNNEGWRTEAPLARWHGVTTDGSGRVVELVLGSNNLSGIIPPELGNLANLEILSLSQHDLSGPIPPELGNLTQLRDLNVSAKQFNSNDGLSGSIPPELGNLANLESLILRNNSLSGSIPRELGGLANLTWLLLDRNSLSGPIPTELGGLANLHVFSISENNLSGSIPTELGGLANLFWLSLDDNILSGPIPPHIGHLANLGYLYLNGNNLTGTVPPELGDLAYLRRMHLDNNALSESLPADLGRLSNLMGLGLSNNAAMSGALPATLTNLRELEALQAGGTGLCAPDDPAFAAWLEGVPKRRIVSCTASGASRAYLTQAVQSRDFPVPLVANEEALLRVFVTAEHASDAEFPPVRATFHVNGAEAHVANIPGTTAPIPTKIDEGSLSGSANAVIPREYLRPGLEVVIEVDPDGTLDPALGVARRIPETGRLAFSVEPMPLFDLTVIPFLWTSDPDSAVMELASGMAEDPYGHELLEDARTLLPVGDLAVEAHEPVWSSSNSAFDLIDETEAIRVLEGGEGHWMGMMSGEVTGAGGVAFRPGRTNFSQPYSGIIAHELGHNMNLGHAPCGGASGLDPSFPYPDGEIGSSGYDFRTGDLVAPSTPDLMSYCGPEWVSDYHFTNALRYRLSDEGASAADAGVRVAESLLLWGGTDTEQELFLNPAFVVDAPAALPDSVGDYTLTGRDASGDELFSLSFAMPEVADGDGRSSFAFVLPVRPKWAGALSSITLSGPDGEITLDEASDRPMAILRNPSTGQVRGFLRDVPPATQAAMDAAGQVGEPGFEVLFSRGIPDAEAWRR